MELAHWADHTETRGSPNAPRKQRRCLSTDVHTSQYLGHSCCRHLQCVACDQHNIQRQCVDEPCADLHHIQHRASRLVCTVCGRQLNHNR